MSWSNLSRNSFSGSNLSKNKGQWDALGTGLLILEGGGFLILENGVERHLVLEDSGSKNEGNWTNLNKS